jgi:hypothetical protein
VDGTKSDMRISLDTQRATYRKHAASTIDDLIRMLDERRDELVDLGEKRAFDWVGVEQYGDGTFWKSGEQLEIEASEELADAIFYLQILTGRRAGDLPEPE